MLRAHPNNERANVRIIVLDLVGGAVAAGWGTVGGGGTRRVSSAGSGLLVLRDLDSLTDTLKVDAYNAATAVGNTVAA